MWKSFIPKKNKDGLWEPVEDSSSVSNSLSISEMAEDFYDRKNAEWTKYLESQKKKSRIEDLDLRTTEAEPVVTSVQGYPSPHWFTPCALPEDILRKILEEEKRQLDEATRHHGLYPDPQEIADSIEAGEEILDVNFLWNVDVDGRRILEYKRIKHDTPPEWIELNPEIAGDLVHKTLEGLSRAVHRDRQKFFIDSVRDQVQKKSRVSVRQLDALNRVLLDVGKNPISKEDLQPIEEPNWDHFLFGE